MLFASVDHHRAPQRTLREEWYRAPWQTCM